MLLVGVAVGLAVAAASTRALRSLLFGIGALDLGTFAAVAAGMVLVGLLAAYLPALRRFPFLKGVSASRALFQAPAFIPILGEKTAMRRKTSSSTT